MRVDRRGEDRAGAGALPLNVPLAIASMRAAIFSLASAPVTPLQTSAGDGFC